MVEIFAYQHSSTRVNIAIKEMMELLWGAEHSSRETHFNAITTAVELASYKQAYVEALSTWADEVAYCKAMNLWRLKRAAGVV